MNEMVISKATTEFEVLTTITEPKVGDKWEDARNIYTITSVKRLYLTQLPLYENEYYIVNVDVWDKDICNPDEPMTIIMKYDRDALWQLENELEEERIKNEDFHDYKKVYEE